MTDRRRVVITGMGVVTALGETADEMWDRLVGGESGVGPVTRFDASGHEVQFGGECTQFDPPKHLERKLQKRMDRFAQFALVAARTATADSGLDFQAMDGRRIGVVIGSGIGGLMELEDQHARLTNKGPRKLSAFTIPKLMVNAASGNISMEFNGRGPSTAVATACASATHAMGDSLRMIQHRYADVVITGGAEAALTPLGLGAFASMKALSTRNDDPAKASRPFDRDRDGFVLGEGAGLLVFEEMEHARKRGARIYGEVLGFGMSSDASHITQPCENGSGAIAAMELALADATSDPDTIDYINAHGTSTPMGDLAETKAIKQVFGDHAYKLAVSSTKSCLGHLLGASGGVELIATIQAMRHNLAPPTINLENPDPACDLDYVPNKARDMRIRRAMSNSFGFGGHNATLVVGPAD